MAMWLVCGSRGWTDQMQADLLLDWVWIKSPTGMVIHGGAAGGDTMAHVWAASKSIVTEVVKPSWDVHGKSAGFVRNIQMLDMKPDVVIALWDGESKGTMHTIKHALLRGITTHVFVQEAYLTFRS